MSTDLLRDFAANEVGWAQVLERLMKAHSDYLHQAAREDGEAHLVAKGRLEGIEKALELIARTRTALRSKES